MWINKQLILAVWKQSNKQYKIEFQDKNKLIIIMRYVFIEYAKNLWAYLKFNNKIVFLTLDLIMLSVATPKRTTNETKKSTGNAKYEWALSLICHLWFFQAIKANYIVMIKIIIAPIKTIFWNPSI